jgi:uncharacterized protein
VVRREDLLNEVGVQFSKRYGVEHRVVVLDVSREDFIGRLASAANDLGIALSSPMPAPEIPASS